MKHLKNITNKSKQFILNSVAKQLLTAAYPNNVIFKHEINKSAWRQFILNKFVPPITYNTKLRLNYRNVSKALSTGKDLSTYSIQYKITYTNHYLWFLFKAFIFTNGIIVLACFKSWK